MQQEPPRPFFSVILPIVDQNVHLLPFTLDSIAEQVFDAYEVIVIDAQTKEHSLGVFDAYRSHITRIYTALDRNMGAMLNKGIDLSRGEYLHFLRPGEFYISRHALRFVKEFIDESPAPDLVYTGSVIRHSLAPAQQFFKQIEEEDLRSAKLPQSLQFFWFKKGAILRVGKFKTRFHIQAGFELICRIYRIASMRKLFMRRILTDYEYRLPQSKWIVRQLFETLQIIFIYYGLTQALFSCFYQNALRFCRWLSCSIKGAFWKGRAAV